MVGPGKIPHRVAAPGVAEMDRIGHVLAAQDEIADCAEDLGVLLNMRIMEPPPEEVSQGVVQCAQKPQRPYPRRNRYTGTRDRDR